MPSPEEIEETLSDIANDRIRDLAAHILKGTKIPRSWGGSFNEDDQFLNQINQWRLSGSIERLPLNKLDEKQTLRLKEMELKLVEKIAHQFQETEQPTKPQKPTAMVTNYDALGSTTQSPSRPTKTLPMEENDVLDTAKNDVLHVLQERKAEVDKEPKGFRKGHDQRLFAINEIIKEVEKQQGKFTLTEIENKVKERLAKENPNKLAVFDQGIQDTSAVHKNKESRYKVMKDRINELTSLESHHTQKPK